MISSYDTFFICQVFFFGKQCNSVYVFVLACNWRISKIPETSTSEFGSNELKQFGQEVEWFGWQTDPWYQDPDDPFVKTVLSCLESACGQKMEVSGATAGLDNRFSLYFGFPSICFGPDGSIYHSFDEYVELDSLVLTTKAVALATLDWCSGERRRE